MLVTMWLLLVHGNRECLGVGPVCDMDLPRFQQPQSNGNLPLFFFVVIIQLFSWIILLMIVYILDGTNEYIFFKIVYVIEKLGGTMILQIIPT